MTFRKAQGIRGMAQNNDWPRCVEEEPEIYQDEQLGTLFAACAEERFWYEFFLMTGEREQEVMYTPWTDINIKAFDGSRQSQTRARLDAKGQFRFVGCLKLLHCGDTSTFCPRADLFLGA